MMRILRSSYVHVALVVGLVATASATVTQVDGTIVPVTNALQQAFDTYELPAGTIDAVTEAAEGPQIFRPRLSSPVVFKDIREGAGFENSFGWYNVGDDVLTAAGRTANLHPVMGCGRPMVNGPGNATTHSGNPAFYIQSAEEPNSVGVDFASEQTAGRYKGGFIGFYLITPESNPSSNNCGDFKNGSDGQSLFGFIYFTQKDLNNDGDFVHHLVYTSQTPDRFYFGFEDLFRGGDNDFEDMAMRIDGLTPPCVPQAEVCDGIDNDCDGQIDAADPDLGGAGVACTCDGAGLACDNGPRFGQCQVGVTQCTSGEIVCHGTGTPSTELCNGLDDNCNNAIDDNPAGTGGSCDGQDADLCPEGKIVCQGAQLVCDDPNDVDVETCNGIDDDCDGPTDEGNPGGGGSCGSSVGACRPGTFVCSGGGLVCSGATGGGPELCNGIDDDCDGVIDDNPTDVGQSCGASNVGECGFGQTICVGGSLSCAGEIGPSPEICNNLDDDCDSTTDDNPVDAGQPCGSSIGECTPGTFVCAVPGVLVCMGGTGATTEICNGLDDDCDGVVDDGVPGEGEACGTGAPPCGGGMTRCIDGTMQCVGGAGGGTETCNNVDDDCDGVIDDGDLCDGGVCDHGVCAAPCALGEFPCPSGKRCDAGFCVDDPCYGVTCPAAANGDQQQCRDGACQPVCPTITCPAGLVCRGSDAACVPDTCDYLPKCAADQVCVGGTCLTNPCLGVTCPSDQFCRDGGCVGSCEGVQCSALQTCRDGACVATGCSIDCGTQVCDPGTGQCRDDRCSAVQCPSTQVCDPLTGGCVPDPCQGVTCPSGQACRLGQCGTSARGALVTTGGGGGCAAGGGDSGSLAVGVLAVLWFVRRRRAVRAAAVAAAVLIGGCSVNEYCLQCAVQGGDGGVVGDGGGDGGGGGGDAGGPSCDPNQIHPETCNHADDDCDGAVDETFDLQGDELNCGACGIECNKPGAQTSCQAGACTITGCFPGFSDRNGDITGPYAQSDGCEYLCFKSNGGVEACDTLDNDCDGAVDETFDKTTDPDNCGVCGRTCEFFEATGRCIASACSFDPVADCNAGYHDANGMQTDGCEYQCTITNGGIEACDVVDNNCDGTVDEGFDVMTDPNNCGLCGRVCQFPNATASCTAGACGFTPSTDCAPGFVDVNGKQVDGCEYPCSPTNGGVEICDAIDNDCDGTADDNPSDAGGPCASTTPPSGACIANGTLSCASGQLVCTGATESIQETCDNVDNDCDGSVDDGVSRSCYTGAMGTNGIGVCKSGVESCAAGMFGACLGQVTPTAEQCNNLDDNCDGSVDVAAGGGPLTRSCYGGPPGTAGVGTCVSGTQTCSFGAFGNCNGQVIPAVDLCGDNLDTDCDARDDAMEGCLALDPEQRLDAPGGGLGEATPGSQHSYDPALARGGSPLGTNVYAVWSQLVGGTTEVYLRKSSDGGQTWGTIINVTSSVAATAVKPVIAVAPGTPDRVIVAYQTVSGGVRDIRVQVSVDGGASFGAASSALDAAGDSFHHALAVRGTTVVVAWEKLDTSTLNRDIKSRTSTDGGATFAAERSINVGSVANPTRFAGRPQVGITAAGDVVWTWREQRAGSTRDIFAARSASPGTAAPASDLRIDSDTLQNRDSDFPVMVVSGASAYLVWQDVSTISGGGADAMFARSTNGGTSWSAERVLDDPAAEVSSSFTPSLAVDPLAAGDADDLVAVAWEDRRQGTQIVASISSDGGATFGAPVRASSDTGDPITGQTSVPAIASAGAGVLAVAYQHQQVNQPPHVFVASSIDSGATWTVTQARLDQGAGPALVPQIVGSVAAGGPAAVATWTDFRAGTQVRGDIFTALSR